MEWETIFKTLKEKVRRSQAFGRQDLHRKPVYRKNFMVSDANRILKQTER